MDTRLAGKTGFNVKEIPDTDESAAAIMEVFTVSSPVSRRATVDPRNRTVRPVVQYSLFLIVPNGMLDRRLSVAPMMGCTDQHCRHLLRLLSPHALLYTEMVVTGALLFGDSRQYLAHCGDEPVALQLGGSNPEELARCAVMAEDAGYQEINLNVGCPSDRVRQGGIGACLMKSPQLVADCYAAMQSAVRIPITIKSRTGIDEHDSLEFLERFIGPIYDAGCRTFIVHARKAILSGLSPKENREIPPLDYNAVDTMQQRFPEADFILNGGIRTLEETLVQAGRFRGVMLGRAVYNNPWLLARIDSNLYGTDVPDRSEVLDRYVTYMQAGISKGVAFRHMARHLLGFYAGVPGARAFRRHLSEHLFDDDHGPERLAEAISLIHETPCETSPNPPARVLS